MVVTKWRCYSCVDGWRQLMAIADDCCGHRTVVEQTFRNLTTTMLLCPAAKTNLAQKCRCAPQSAAVSGWLWHCVTHLRDSPADGDGVAAMVGYCGAAAVAAGRCRCSWFGCFRRRRSSANTIDRARPVVGQRLPWPTACGTLVRVENEWRPSIGRNSTTIWW